MKLMTPGILACLLCWAILPVAVALQRKTSKPPSLGSSRPRESCEKPEKSLLEVGRAQKLRQAQFVEGQIKAISYNIRWRSGAELDKLVERRSKKEAQPKHKHCEVNRGRVGFVLRVGGAASSTC